MTWERGGSSPEISRAQLEISLNQGTTWSLLGAASRIAGSANWRLAGITLPQGQIFMIRARGVQAHCVGCNSCYEIIDAFYVRPAGPEIVIEDSNGAVLGDGVSAIDWGGVFSNAPTLRALTIRNIGAQTQTLGLPVLNGTDADSFSYTLPVTSVSPDQGVPLQLSFASPAYGERSAAMTPMKAPTIWRSHALDDTVPD